MLWWESVCHISIQRAQLTQCYVNYVSKKLEKTIFENKKETCVTSSESIKAKGDTLQCHKFKCYSAGEEGLLTHWSPAQGCLLWLQQLVGAGLHQRQEDWSPAGSHFILMRCFDEGNHQGFLLS